MTKRHALIKIIVLSLSLVFAIGFQCRAQPTEYQIKAAFIYNFARFTDWPSTAFSASDSPMIIGVLGKNVFGDDLANTVNGKTINGHPLKFKHFDSVTDAAHCQVLFISAPGKGDLPKILQQLQGTNILTISETDGFIEAGGMINLEIVDQKVRFEINNETAKKAGLNISSKLLSLAINSP
jgi:hypothetical protein